MHVESSKSNFPAQKGRTVTSVERTGERWEGQAAGVSCSCSAPSSFEGGGNMTPPHTARASSPFLWRRPPCLSGI